MSPILKTARFVKEFVKSPTSTGAIAPSSRRLARRMLENVPFTDAKVIVEYGPGTGSFTEHILPSLREETRFFAVEINPGFCASFQKRFPDVTLFEDSVSNIRAICDREEIKEIDCVVSGLPWAAFSGTLQTEIMDAMMTVLRPGGHFVTFAYLHGLVLPSARAFRSRLEEYFTTVEVSRPVWANLPPALCYNCTR